MFARAKQIWREAKLRWTVLFLKRIKADLKLSIGVRILKIGSLQLRIFYLQELDLRRFEEKIDNHEWR
jgi:hypothetical protein